MVDIDPGLYPNGRYQNELKVLQTIPKNTSPDWSETMFLPEKYQPQFMCYQLIGDTVSIMLWHGTKKETDAVPLCYTKNHCNSYHDMQKLLPRLKTSEMVAKRVILSVGYTECRSSNFDLAKCVSNLRNILSILREKGCVEIILTNVPPCARASTKVKHWRCIESMNKMIKKIGEDYADVAVCNIFQLFCKPINFKRRHEYIISGVPNYKVEFDLYNMKSLKNSAVVDLITFSEKGKQVLHNHLMKTVNFRKEQFVITLINSRMGFSTPLKPNDTNNNNDADKLNDSKATNNPNIILVKCETTYEESTKITNFSSTESNFKKDTNEPKFSVNTVLDDRSTIANCVGPSKLAHCVSSPVTDTIEPQNEKIKTSLTLPPKTNSTKTWSKPSQNSSGSPPATNGIPLQNTRSETNSSLKCKTVMIQNKISDFVNSWKHPVTEDHVPVAAKTVKYTIEKVPNAGDRINMKRRNNQNEDVDKDEEPDVKKKLLGKCDGLERSKAMKPNTHHKMEAKPAVELGIKNNIFWNTVNASHGCRQQTSGRASKPNLDMNNELSLVSNVAMVETHSKTTTDRRLKQLHEHMEGEGEKLRRPTHEVRCQNWKDMIKDSRSLQCRTQVNIFLQHPFTCSCEICVDGHEKLMSSFLDLIKMLKKDKQVNSIDRTEPV